MNEKRHEHFGSVVRNADPRLVVDTATTPGGCWATLVLSAPATAPYTHLRPVLSPTGERARQTHDRVAEWVRQLAYAVTCDPEVCQGHLVIRGTRVWVDQILACVGPDGRLNWEEVHANYPTVARDAAEAVAALPGHVRRTLEELCRA